VEPLGPCSRNLNEYRETNWERSCLKAWRAAKTLGPALSELTTAGHSSGRSWGSARQSISRGGQSHWGRAGSGTSAEALARLGEALGAASGSTGAPSVGTH
jgi:hypothetical protein